MDRGRVTDSRRRDRWRVGEVGKKQRTGWVGDGGGGCSLQFIKKVYLENESAGRQEAERKMREEKGENYSRRNIPTSVMPQ